MDMGAALAASAFHSWLLWDMLLWACVSKYLFETLFWNHLHAYLEVELQAFRIILTFGKLAFPFSLVVVSFVFLAKLLQMGFYFILCVIFNSKYVISKHKYCRIYFCKYTRAGVSQHLLCWYLKIPEQSLLLKLLNQQLSTCGLQPLWQTSISKNIYTRIHNSKITVI